MSLLPLYQEPRRSDHSPEGGKMINKSSSSVNTRARILTFLSLDIFSPFSNTCADVFLIFSCFKYLHWLFRDYRYCCPWMCLGRSPDTSQILQILQHWQIFDLQIYPETLREFLSINLWVGAAGLTRGIQWNGFVEILPLWLAPNMVTLLGFFFIVANVTCLEIFMPDLVGPVGLYFHCTDLGVEIDGLGCWTKALGSIMAVL